LLPSLARPWGSAARSFVQCLKGHQA
jgi:hypothetical protein